MLFLNSDWQLQKYIITVIVFCASLGFMYLCTQAIKMPPLRVAAVDMTRKKQKNVMSSIVETSSI